MKIYSAIRKILFTGAFTLAGYAAMAQSSIVMGDNLGNHKATQNLNMNSKNVVNANGVAIGVATFDNLAISLQIGAATGGTTAMVIPRVDDLLNATTPSIPNNLAIDGMMVFNNADKTFYLRANNVWTTFASLSLANGNILIGDATNKAVAHLMTGDATLSNAGVLTVNNDATDDTKRAIGSNYIKSLAVTPDKIALTSGSVLIGNASGASAAVTLTGDVTTTLAGVTTIATASKGNNMVLTTDATGLTTWVAKGLISGVTSNTSALTTNPFTSANRAVTISLPVATILADDGVVVNIKASDATSFDYIMILSSHAEAGTVTVRLADMRPLPEDGVYVAPAFSSLNFIVTSYHAQ